MLNNAIDLRSDTITQPSPGMMKAITEAELGDDVFNDDPTVHRLQEFTAELLGKEAAIYVSSGTMSNQIGVRLHCGRGDELICEAGCHVYNYEQGGNAQLSGVATRTVEGEYGVLGLDQLKGLIRPENEHLVRTKLVCLENTHNRGAGRILPYDGMAEICEWAHDNGLRTHLDGARLFNAVVASGIEAAEWAKHFDTVSVCFSKGLGAPVGSALAGPKDLIETEARRHRKVFGAGMRQAGIIAAGALYALENNIERLAEDHANAQILAEAVRQTEGISLYPDQVDTNIVFFKIDASVGTAVEFTEAMDQKNVRALALGPSLVRLVTNLHITETDAQQAGEAIREVADGLAKGELTVSGHGMAY